MKRALPHKFQNPRRLPAEWVTFIVAAIVVTLLVALVVYTWITQDNQPPTFSVSQGSDIREAEGQFYVPFTVANVGGGTAASVQVIGELRVNGQVEEAGEQQIDFLSGGEQEEGAFVFTRNPEEGDLIVRVASYSLP